MTQTSSGKTQGSLNIINVKNTLKACSIRVKQGVWGLLSKLELKIIRAADGGSAVAEVLARHIVEAGFERPVLAQILVYPYLGIEISRGVGIAAATGTPDKVAREAPAIGHCELRCQLEYGKMIILHIALLSLL